MCFLMLTSSLEVAKTKTKSIWFDKSALLNVQISALLHRMLSFCSFCSTLQPGFRTFANRYHVSPWWRITSSSWQVNCSDSTNHHEVNDPWYTCPSAVAASRNGISSTCQTNTGVVSIHQHHVTGRSSLAVYDVVDSENDVCNFRRINGFPVSSRHPHSGDIVTISSLLGQQRAVFASMWYLFFSLNLFEPMCGLHASFSCFNLIWYFSA